MNTFNSYRKIVLLFVLIIIGQFGFAQERTMVILPSEVKSDAYKKLTSVTFDSVSNLPENSVINKRGDEKILLNLTIEKNALTKNGSCEMYLRHPEFENIASITLKSDDKVEEQISLEIEEKIFDPLKKGNLTLLLTYKEGCFTETTTPLILFYDNQNVTDTAALRKQPKLVVTYDLSSKPHRSDWAQAFGDAQQSNSSDWTLAYNQTDYKNSDNAKSAVASAKSMDGSQFIKDKISIYKNNPITYSKSPDGHGTLISLWTSGPKIDDSKSWSPIWSKTINHPVPKQLPLISENGYMYYFTGENDSQTKMVVLDLTNQGKELDTRTISEIKMGNQGNQAISVIENTVTLGYDGSLYLPTNTGIFALTPYPELKPKWYYNNVGKFGPVSLSEDERIACFIQLESVGQSANPRLVIVDNITGRKLAETKLTECSYDANKPLPPIVIQTISSTKFNAILLNKSDKADQLLSVEIEYSRDLSPTVVKKVGKNILVKSEDNAILNQPVLIKKDNEVLTFDSGLNQRILSFDTKLKREVFAGSFKFYNEKTYLGGYFNGTPIMMTAINDKNKVDINRIMIHSHPGQNGSWLRLNDFKRIVCFAGSTAGKPVFGTDGSCYVINDNELMIYYPILNASRENEKISKVNNKTTYGNDTKITMASQTIASTINAIFLSSEFVFEKGFEVKKGAEMSFKIIKK